MMVKQYSHHRQMLNSCTVSFLLRTLMSTLVWMKLSPTFFRGYVFWCDSILSKCDYHLFFI